MEAFLQKIGRLNFLSMKRKKRIIWKMRSILKSKDFPFEIDFYGLKYIGNTRNQIDKYVYYFGAYEKGMLHFIEKTLSESKDKVFVDIGANIGHHSLFASRTAKKVYSFEPYKKVRDEILKKIEINKISNISVSPFGLGEKDEQLTYFEPADHNTGTGSFIDGYLAENKNNGLKLEIRNASSLFKEIGIENISLIKIDVEGFEPLVLSGLLEVMKLQKPIIIIEFSKTSKEIFETKKELVQFIKANYQTLMFDNPNEYNYKLVAWNFDKTGNVVLIPKN